MRTMEKVIMTMLLFLLTAPVTAVYAGDDIENMVGLVISNQEGELNIVGDDTDLEWSCLTDDARAYDLLTGLPVYADEIEEGTYIRVFFDTRRPVLWINCWEEGAAAFKATVSENIQYSEGTCYFLTGDEKYRVTLTDETFILDPDEGFVDPSDIKPGCEMFVWVDMVTASFPAQTYPSQVVLIK